MEITLELGCCKYPLASTLEGHWNANRGALLKFLQQVHIGEYWSSASTCWQFEQSRSYSSSEGGGFQISRKNHYKGSMIFALRVGGCQFSRKKNLGPRL